MEENYDFRIFGQLDLAKSCGDKEDDDWEIGGLVLDEVDDVSGEAPVLKSMDWSYLDERGVFKYEHDPRNKYGRPIPTPVNIIGVPHFREERGKSVFIKGALLPEQPMAQETRRLIKALRKHNEKYPGYRRTLGFSIEGNYIQKSLSGKRRYTGKVFNVVITPNPQGTTTYAELVQKSMETFAKSLEIGHPIETDLTKKKQGQAIQEEVIDKKAKVTAEDIGGGKKGKKKFKNYDEAYRFYRKKYRPVEADKLAKQHFNKE